LKPKFIPKVWLDVCTDDEFVVLGEGRKVQWYGGIPTCQARVDESSATIGVRQPGHLVRGAYWCIDRGGTAVVWGKTCSVGNGIGRGGTIGWLRLRLYSGKEL
jgi:hypothetical protein